MESHTPTVPSPEPPPLDPYAQIRSSIITRMKLSKNVLSYQNILTISISILVALGLLFLSVLTFKTVNHWLTY